MLTKDISAPRAWRRDEIGPRDWIVPLSAAGLTELDAVVNSPALSVEFTLERGQVQFISNRHFAHSRTEFVDAAEPTLERHLIRRWTREDGRLAFHA